MDVTRLLIDKNGNFWNLSYLPKGESAILVLETDDMIEALDAYVYLYNQYRDLPGADEVRTWADAEQEVANV
jgi:hypothetical protein